MVMTVAIGNSNNNSRVLQQ